MKNVATDLLGYEEKKTDSTGLFDKKCTDLCKDTKRE
jgi:hypothetical protein